MYSYEMEKENVLITTSVKSSHVCKIATEYNKCSYTWAQFHPSTKNIYQGLMKKRSAVEDYLLKVI